MTGDRKPRFEPSRLPDLSESAIIDEIRRVVGLFDGEIPNSAQFKNAARVSLSSICKRFGSYVNALAQAGFNYKNRKYSAGSRRWYTPEQVLDNLRDVLGRAEGYEFTIDFYRKNGGLFKTRDSVRKYLGLNWEDALAKAGATKRTRVIRVSLLSQRLRSLAEITTEELLAELDLAWQRKGGYPTRAEFNQGSKHLNAQFYASRFGSWSKAVEALCEWKKYPRPRIPGTPNVARENISNSRPRGHGAYVTNDELIIELLAVQRKHPLMPISYPLYRSSGGSYHIDTFKSHFGSWTKAVRTIGGDPGLTTYSEDELFDEIQRMWEKLGRQPTVDEMKNEGEISPGTYRNRFGSWIKAVHAFCEDRNSDRREPDEPPADAMIPADTNVDVVKRNSGTIIPGVESNLRTTPSAVIILRKTGRRIGERLRWRALVRDNFTCQGCGRNPKEHGITLHADHIIAYSNGGETVLENLQALCSDCNLGKSNL